jgi:alpha-D-xyloside xylohydrolase
MDFANDKQALNINDEYLFGKLILVCPVTNSMYSKDTKEDFSTIKSKELYLPKGADWYDFWTGEKQSGGQKITKETPLDIIPIYIKAGSILPFGPKVQYATEKKWDNLEIRIYPGANGEFTLYEDENDNYNYEKGAFSTIKFTWNDAKKVLRIDDCKGTFTSMLAQRKFNLVLIAKNKGTGVNTVETFDKVVVYERKKSVVKF